MSVELRCGQCDLVISQTKIPVTPLACPRCGAFMQTKIDPLVGRTIGGCKLIRRVGMGAMAVVYEAEQVSDKQKVAVKMLTGEASKDPENGVRFAREAELCMKIHHPNVVAVYRHGCENKIYFMVMEFVDGATMEHVIDKSGIMAWKDVVHLFLQVAQALDHISKQGIVHRDIKPGNILLTKSGIAKVLDLGFAKSLGTGDSERMVQSGELTMQGISMGSPSYMPPEQVMDAKSAEATADVYSLGASFFHALTGQTPFNGKTAYEIMEKVLREPAPTVRSINPNVPKAIDQLISWTLEKKPEHRPQTPSEFIRELENAMFQPEDSKRIVKLRSKQKGHSMTTVMIIVGAALVVGAIIAVVVIMM
jgi:eukaryotic-like serine/threonine-protein kinase